LPEFQENGAFSIRLYRQRSNTDKMNLWRQTQERIALERYAGDLMELSLPQGETDFLKSMAAMRRTFKMVAFALSDYPDSEVLAFAAENPGLFKTTQLSRITITSSEREARQILSSLQNGSLSFEDAVSTHSQDSLAEQGGSLGQRMAYELAAELSDEAQRAAVLSLTRGAFSDVVKVPSGWAIYRCDEEARPMDGSDSALTEKIKNYMLDAQRGIVENWCTVRAEAFSARVAASGDFDGAALSEGLNVQSFGPLPLNYGQFDTPESRQNNVFGASALLSSFNIPELSYAPGSEIFWTRAFSAPPGTPSKPVVMGGNVLVLYPESEVRAEDSELENIAVLYPYLSQYFVQQDLRSQILSSPKFKDRFLATFNRSIWPSE
jgi:hypothetical protein